MTEIPKTYGIWAKNGWGRSTDGHIFVGSFEAMQAQFLDMHAAKEDGWQIRAIGSDGKPLEDIDIGTAAEWMQRAQVAEARIKELIAQLERTEQSEDNYWALMSRTTDEANCFRARVKELEAALEDWKLTAHQDMVNAARAENRVKELETKLAIEREACAQIAEEWSAEVPASPIHSSRGSVAYVDGTTIAELIRARNCPDNSASVA